MFPVSASGSGSNGLPPNSEASDPSERPPVHRVTAMQAALPERIVLSIAELVPQGVLAIANGQVRVLNGAGAAILGVDAGDAVGRPLDALWPELARALDLGRPLRGELLRIRQAAVRVTSASAQADRRDEAVVTFVQPQPARTPSHPHRAADFPFRSGTFIGVTPAIARVRDVARIAAHSSSSVLIEGESGVGKEVVAQAIHAAGNRSRQPFVGVLCAAIPRELLEGELFGYRSGSVTGASRGGRAGKFELADGGTLLLEDVVDIPLDLQAKILRVLQERVVTRLGGSRPRPVDVRIVATSKRSVADAVRAGLFRADLYYALNVLNICIPPLRDRREDIQALAEHFLQKHAAAHGSRLRTIGAEAVRALEKHAWPGNARELEHWIESEIHFSAPGQTCLARLTREPKEVAPRQTRPMRTLRELERELYAGALAEAQGDISRAARGLGISRGKLYRKLRLYELLSR
jgi:transcriptional regulator with PAS, ATPase and Fis domain